MTPNTVGGPWSRMDQLLKCSVCSDRFRNPKLLPCNHTFCAEPCLSKFCERGGAVRCPECGAEHRCPAQGFPHNVTLGRFLELRQQVVGHEPELPASMQRCNACKEKGRLETCAHCARKICADCKAAHVNILRKEIALINGQVREGLQLLSGALHATEENAEKLQKNYSQVKDEIEEVVRRYTRDLLSTEAKLKHNLDLYLKNELRSMRRLEHDLQIELSNVHSNCDLVDKYVNNGVDWTDAELTDYKEIFMKTLDFLRAFDADPTDCVRKVKFHPRADPDHVHKTLVDFAEVKINEENTLLPPPDQPTNQYSSNSNLNAGGPTVTLTPPSALSRSQSDHKLARHQKRGVREDDLEPPPQTVTRRFRDRFTRDRDSCERELSPSSSWRRELDEVRRGHRFDEPQDEPTTTEQSGEPGGREVGMSGTEDATKGPLSGVIRILDSPHVMERLHNSEIKQKKEKEEEERRARMPKVSKAPPPPRPMTRQLSEDEIEKQKKENKAAAAATAAATPKVESRTPKPSILKKEEEAPSSRPSYTSKYGSSRGAEEPRSSRGGEETPKIRSWRTNSSAATEREVSQSPPSSPTRSQKPPVSPRLPPTPARQSRFLPRPSSLETTEDPPSTPERPSSPVTRRSTPTTPTGGRPHLRLAIRAEPSSSSSSSSESESEEEEVDSETAVKRGDISPSVNTLLARSAQARKQSATTQARILGRPDDRLPRPPGTRSWRDSVREDDEDLARIRERNKERDSLASSRRKTSITEPEGRTSPYSRFLDRRRSSVHNRRDNKSPPDDRRSRLARSKSSHDLCPGGDDSPPDSDEPPARSWSNYMRNKYGAGLVRSRTAASLVAAAAAESSEEEPDDSGAPAGRRRDYHGSSVSPRAFSAPRRTYMQKGKTSFKFGTRGSERGCFTWPRGVCVGSDNTIVVADSNNHRVQVFNSGGKYVQEFGSYGSGDGEFDCLAGVTVNRIGQFIVSDRYNHRLQVFDPSGRFIRAFGCEGRMDGKFSYPWGVATDNLGFIYVCDKENHRIQAPTLRSPETSIAKSQRGQPSVLLGQKGVPRGRHVRDQVRWHRAASWGAGAPSLRGRELHQPSDRERQQQPPRPDLRRQRPPALHLRHGGLRGGTVQVPQGGGGRRPGIPLRRRLRE